MLTRSEKLNDLLEMARNTDDLKEFVKIFDNDTNLSSASVYITNGDAMEF